MAFLFLILPMAMAANLNHTYFDYPPPIHYNFQNYQLVKYWPMQISNCGSRELECQSFSTPLLLQRPDGRLQKAKLFYDCESVRGPSEYGNYECFYKDSRTALFIDKKVYQSCDVTEAFNQMLCH